MDREKAIERVNEKLHAWNSRLNEAESPLATKKDELKANFSEQRARLDERSSSHG